MGLLRKEDMHESFWKEGVSSPNLLINGDFQIWQRGTNFSNILKSYTADRWVVHSSSKVDVIKEGQSLKISKPTTNTNTNITANLWQILEKPNSLRTKTVVLSFKARSSSDLSMVCSIGVGNNFDGSTNIISNTVKLTKNGDLYSIVFDLSNHNWETDSNICVNFRFSNFEQIWVSQVKLEIGNNATPFTPRPYGEELALCQRYYINYPVPQSLIITDATQIGIDIHLPVSLRVNPTILLNNDCYFHTTSSQTPIKIHSAGDSLGCQPIEGNLSDWLLWFCNGGDECAVITDGLMGVINTSNGDRNKLSGACVIKIDAEIY